MWAESSPAAGRVMVSGRSQNAMRMAVIGMVSPGSPVAIYKEREGGFPAARVEIRGGQYIWQPCDKWSIHADDMMLIDPRDGHLFGRFLIRTENGAEEGPFDTLPKARAAAIRAINEGRWYGQRRREYKTVQVSDCKGRFGSSEPFEVLWKPGTRTYRWFGFRFVQSIEDLPTLNPDGSIRSKGKTYRSRQKRQRGKSETMNTYYVYYEMLFQKSQDSKYTDPKPMKAANLDNLRARLAADVLKRTNSRYMYTAFVMKDIRKDTIGAVMPISDTEAVWEPMDDAHMEEGAHYVINPRTGRLGKKTRWFRWHPR